MKILKINLEKITEEEIEIISDYFRHGKIVAYPTDTIYGLGCIAKDEKAIDKIYKIKKRLKNKPLPVLVKSYCMLKKYFFVSGKQDKFIREKNQESRVASFILKSRGLLPQNAVADDESAAVRIPFKSEFLIKILKKINTPIIATSLNISGEKQLEDLKKIEKYFGKNKIDLALDAGKLKKSKPSKLIDIRDIDNIKIIRN